MKIHKKIANKLQLQKFFEEESAQGMVEYILLIVIVLSLAYAFRGKIKGAFDSKLGEVDNGLQSFKVEQ